MPDDVRRLDSSKRGSSPRNANAPENQYPIPHIGIKSRSQAALLSSTHLIQQ
jgi:hypothetical protein